jgi:hypothetical protein
LNDDVELVELTTEHYLFDKINRVMFIKGSYCYIIEELNLLPGIYKIDFFRIQLMIEIIKEVSHLLWMKLLNMKL